MILYCHSQFNNQLIFPLWVLDTGTYNVTNDENPAITAGFSSFRKGCHNSVTALIIYFRITANDA